MRPKTEELLNFLVWWTLEKASQPTFRNLTESYESWAYRKGILREARRLEQRRLVECDRRSEDGRLWRLTEQGRVHALGGRDPEARWSRDWDGNWRLVIFDVPLGQDLYRQKLRRYLRERGFGWLQKSVWITPDPMEVERELLKGERAWVESLVLLTARPCGGESDEQIVAGAWDFERMNHRYTRHLKILDQRPEGALRDESAGEVLRRWAAAERKAWLDAVTIDPLLPERLLPPGYLGRRAWQRRLEVLRKGGRQLRTFRS